MNLNKDSTGLQDLHFEDSSIRTVNRGGEERMNCDDAGLLRLLEKMFRTYRGDLIRARKQLIRAREENREADFFHWQGICKEILAAFDFYGFEIEPIMKTYEIDLAMLGMEK